MKIEIRGNKVNYNELNVGDILISNNDEVLLIIETGDVFNVFDLGENSLRCYNAQEYFAEDFTAKEVYRGEEIKIILDKN